MLIKVQSFDLNSIEKKDTRRRIFNKFSILFGRYRKKYSKKENTIQLVDLNAALLMDCEQVVATCLL